MSDIAIFVRLTLEERRMLRQWVFDHETSVQKLLRDYVRMVIGLKKLEEPRLPEDGLLP